MSDLTGEDAFDRVFEAAMEARHSARTAEGRVHEAEAEARRLRSENETLRDASRRDQANLNRDEAARTPKLKELWEASEALYEHVGPGGALVLRLRAALEGAKDYCDQPPF